MRLRFPNPLVLLVAGILIAMVLTWVLPAGEFDRWEDPATGRQVVVAGTYHGVAQAPVGPFSALLGIPRGLVDAASVVFLVFLAGGAFAVRFAVPLLALIYVLAAVSVGTAIAIGLR